MYSLGVIFFLLCLPMHACNARCLGYAAEDIDNHADFLAKDVNKLKLHDQLEMRSSISKEVQTQEYGVHGIRKQENGTDANNMKQTLCNFSRQNKLLKMLFHQDMKLSCLLGLISTAWQK
ncbi:hypothetical protein ES332_D12G261600v1 [Gossypium tomentosum]|uniref:Uncharacterized protein n=1 Tax=Gossypium tomentosum TaxID=34277 RepID=A0A5D2IFG5_GOSTO|nr:hypothetical protein ES332_D12G261600v1 [Gossypium tomentosum]TYH40650.1 hypothetical protein ES332_D12G261600v1 [Gossypium tomentosum]